MSNLELPYYDGNYVPDFPVVPLPAAWASDLCEQLTGIRGAVTCVCIDIGCDVIILPNDEPDAAYREYVHIAMWPRRTSDHGADFQDVRARHGGYETSDSTEPLMPRRSVVGGEKCPADVPPCTLPRQALAAN